MPYNGYKNWNQWNVSLWINNDERLWQEAVHFVRYYGVKSKAAQGMLDWLHDQGITETPDGAKYTKTAIRAAMVGM